MTTLLVTDTHCSATTTAGNPCRSIAVLDCGHCSSHCPERREEMMEARRRGGRNSSAVERAYSRLPSDLASVARILGETIVAVRDGQLSPGIGNSIASLSRALIGAIESGNLTTRMDDLEGLLGRLDEHLDLRSVA